MTDDFHQSENVARKAARIGAVSYLNSRPLVDRLSSLAGSEASVHLDYPSRLASGLAAGQYDVALVPAIEVLRHSDWQIISDACIACRREVWSVQVLFRCKPQDVRTLAVDAGSRTSAALAQILLYERYGIRPEVVEFPLHASIDSSVADATLCIGDRAMYLESQRDQFETLWDLGQQWTQQTQRPFVFAVWACQPSRLSEDQLRSLENILQRSRDEGVADAVHIAARSADEYRLPAVSIERYFHYHLHFTLDQAARDGLRLFFEKAAALGLDRAADLRGPRLMKSL